MRSGALFWYAGTHEAIHAGRTLYIYIYNIFNIYILNLQKKKKKPNKTQNEDGMQIRGKFRGLAIEQIGFH